MHRQRVSGLAFAVLVLLSSVAVTTPAAASASSTEVSTDAAGTMERTYNGTALLAMAATGNGGVVAGGLRGRERSNATLLRVDEDGETAWSRTFEGSNATRVVDLAATEDEVYVLVSERSPVAGSFETAHDLVKATADGDIVWRRALNTTAAAERSVEIVATDEGVTVASADDGSVSLTGYAGGDPLWERSYGVQAVPRALHETDEGYVLVGEAGFDNPWVLRTTSAGRERFNRTYPGIDTGRVAGGVTTADGGVLLVGQRRVGYGSDSTSTWSAGLDADGDVRWTRVHDIGAGLRTMDVVGHEDGAMLVGRESNTAGSATARLIGIGADGASLFDERIEGAAVFTAATRTGEAVTVAGVSQVDPDADTEYVGSMTEVSIPDAPLGADATLDHDVEIDSNTTVYRGQDLLVDVPYWTGPTYDLVRLPGERDEFDPHAVRRFDLNASGAATIESATLPDGRYALRTADGRYVTVKNGRIMGHGDSAEAAFRVRSQQLFRVETNRTFVDVAGGERGVSLTFDSDRTGYDVYVTADRRRGGAATASELRAALERVPGFVGVETVDGRPAARITIDERARPAGNRPRNDVGIAADASAFGAGLYEVTVGSVDTRDGGTVASGRVLVGTVRDRPLGVDLGTDSLSVAAGEEGQTNITLLNVTDGISALSLAANRTGKPAVRLRLRSDINASRASAWGSTSRDAMGTGTTALDGSTPNGTVSVGTFGVEARGFRREPIANGTTNVTFEIQWVVDQNGVPYSVPDDRTVAVEVVRADDGSDDKAFDDWFDDVDTYNGTTVDARDQDEVTVTVGAEGNGGAFAFDPPALRVDPGTTVVWQWSGDGGAHNVVAEDGTFESGPPAAEAGATFEHTFEEAGVYKYISAPHRGLGMKGAVVVGDTAVDEDTGSGESGGSASGSEDTGSGESGSSGSSSEDTGSGESGSR
jgi:halocyanin-like protein